MTNATRIVLSPAKPLDSAKQFLALKRPNLIRHQNLWLDWKAGCYSVVEDQTILAEITYFCDSAVTVNYEKIKNEKTGKVTLKPKDVRFPVTPFARKKIFDMLADHVHKPAETMSPPCWLDGRAGPDPHNIMSCENGLLDVVTRKLIAPTPAFFTTTMIPVSFKPDAKPPAKWEQYLEQVTTSPSGEKRPHLRAALCEMTGYLLSSDTSLHKLFQLYGPTRSGKGTFMRVLNALIGPQNISNASIGDLSEKYGCENLLNKSVCMVTDADTGDRREVGKAAANINRISGGDPVDVRRMAKPALTSVKLGVRFVIGMNHLPNFGSHAAALLARLNIFPFDNSFEGREDFKLTDKLLAELPGVLNWALEGLRTLRKRGTFEEPPESREIKERLTGLSSVAAGFIRDMCVVSPKSRIDANVLFAAFNDYVTANKGRGLSAEDFAEAIRDLTKGAARRGQRGHAGSGGRVFWGIRLNNSELVARFQHDPVMVDLCSGRSVTTLKRAPDGWLIPTECSEFN
jgi:putative DNA primase/helicase